MNAAIQAARGGVASQWGESYDVRRLDGSTNVSISNNSPVISGFKARIKRTTNKQYIEGQTFELLVYEFECNNLDLEQFDQLTGTEAGGPVTYIFAGDRITRQSVFMRAEASVTITRPWPTALDDSQQPSSGGIALTDGAWSGTVAAHEKILTLTDGLYDFSTEPDVTPAVVACGLSMNARFSEGKTLDVPVEQYKDQFVCYLPNLNGEMLNELDRINFGSTERYEIAKILQYSTTDFAGYVLFLLKMGF